MLTEKECTKCLQVKPVEQFRRQTRTKSGYSYYCIDCLKPMVAENNKKRYEHNRETLIAQVQEWQKLNKDKIRIYNKTAKKKPIERIKKNLRNRIKEVLGYKDFSLSQTLGCTPKEFRQYLSSKFRDGMTWENYGLIWHIDHIRPLSDFDLNIKEQRIEANHFSNLQPLLINENLKKGDKLNHIDVKYKTQ
jgi:hypothetical protein